MFFDYCDAKNSLLDISKNLNTSENVIRKIIKQLDKLRLIKKYRL